MSGSRLALDAVGPQDYFVYSNVHQNFQTPIQQHTAFSIDQVNFISTNAQYIGSRQQFIINPKTLGADLISNMHLNIKLPKLALGETYSDNIGRTIIKSFTFSLNDQIIENITADWLVIKDQILLDSDEKNGMFQVLNNGYSFDTDDFKQVYKINPTEVELFIPIEFFFCRRHSPYRKERDRVARPFFPVCSVLNQLIYVTIEFQPQTFFTNSSMPMLDLLSPPVLVVETITLTPEERFSIISTQTPIYINRVYKEPTNILTNGTGRFNFTVNFPISLTCWFFRRRDTEDVTTTTFYDDRFKFGYTYTNNSILQNIDPFNFLRIFINNCEITTNNVEALKFYKYIQPLNYNLSTPSNEIYMYSFGTGPKEYNTDGTFDFSLIPAKSSFIDFKLNDQIATDISTNYSFNVYHYGYSILKFTNGFGGLLYT
jgi:hypothetical protein